MSWLDCQINGIADHVCGPAGTKYDINQLKAVKLSTEAGDASSSRLPKRIADTDPLYWEDICDRNGGGA